MKKNDDFAKPKLVLGESFSVFARLATYIDCYYEATVCWNPCSEKDGFAEVRYKQAGKTLCSFYIKDGSFDAVFVLDAAERVIFEGMGESISPTLRKLYDASSIEHDAKWIKINVRGDESFADVKLMLGIKRKPNGMTMTMCGLKCGKCRAYAKNAENEQEAGSLAEIWLKNYGVQIDPTLLVCDGCRCQKKDARILDDECPVRACVLERHLHHCGQCDEFPCEKFDSRQNYCFEAKVPINNKAIPEKSDYDDYMIPYDNRTRLMAYKKKKLKIVSCSHKMKD